MDYVDDLVKAGFNEAQSKAQAKALFRVIEQNAVTKQDLKELEVKLSTEMKELDVRLTTQMKELELKIAHEMKELGSSLLIRLTGIIAAMLTLAITAIGFLIHFLH